MKDLGYILGYHLIVIFIALVLSSRFLFDSMSKVFYSGIIDDDGCISPMTHFITTLLYFGILLMLNFVFNLARGPDSWATTTILSKTLLDTIFYYLFTSKPFLHVIGKVRNAELCASNLSPLIYMPLLVISFVFTYMITKVDTISSLANLNFNI